VTERDLSRKVSDNDASSKNTILQDVISSPLVIIDYISQVAKDIEKSKNYEIRVEGEVKQMIEEKMRFCKQAGVKSQVYYKIQTGKPVDEIVKMSEDVNVDLIVIASSRKPSLTTRLLGSTSRKVIDSIEKPVLLIHG
jgi:nucleotide-binding universal stress UspA family protein